MVFLCIQYMTLDMKHTSCQRSCPVEVAFCNIFSTTAPGVLIILKYPRFSSPYGYLLLGVDALHCAACIRQVPSMLTTDRKFTSTATPRFRTTQPKLLGVRSEKETHGLLH